MALHLKFCYPIYDRTVILQQMEDFCKEGVVRIIEHSDYSIQLELLLEQAEAEVLELANNCLLESFKKNGYKISTN